ncbi:MAG: GAF domain-containing sensor histidine kinase [Nitrolancea sp.]
MNSTKAAHEPPRLRGVRPTNGDHEDPTRELSTLLEVSRLITSVLELSPLLDLILTQLDRVASYSGASIWLLDADGLVMVADRAPEGYPVEAGLRIPSEKLSWVDGDAESVIVTDVQDEQDQSAGARSYRAAVGGRFGYSRSWMRIPLVYQGKTIGMISLSHVEPGHFTPHHADLAMAIANQAAVAITNARLIEQAQTMGALEERQRLARELHDSVTQALFSTTLHARAAQLAFEQTGLDPDGLLGRSIADVRELTQGALAEMRALIFELRPGALAEEGLAQALRKQAAALSAREGIDIVVDLPEPRLSLAAHVEENLYRIVLEALHNTMKHAGAEHAWVRLARNERELRLEIVDDGAGFDPVRPAPGHLGLHTMADRAQAIGANLTIDSTLGQGTTVRITLSLQTETAIGGGGVQT